MKKFKFCIPNLKKYCILPVFARVRAFFKGRFSRKAICFCAAALAAVCFCAPIFNAVNLSALNLSAPIFVKRYGMKKANALEFDDSTGYISSGDFINAAVLLTFSDQEPAFPENFEQSVNLMYNDSPVSVKNFFKAQSKNKLNVKTLIAGKTDSPLGAKIYASAKSAKSYMPRYGRWINFESRYEEINESGYDNRYYNDEGVPVAPSTEGAKISGERILIEQRLVREAINLAKSDIEKQLDKEGGKLHSLAIITDANGTKAEWGDILWSHKSVCLSAKTLFGNQNVVQSYSDYYFSEENKREYADLSDVFLGDGKISAYNIIASGELTARKIGNYVTGLSEETANLYDVGLLAHELMHGFGFGDYYSYINKNHETVGEFDVLASPDPLPQYSLSYVREKAGWLGYDDFLYINKSGTYTLYPVGNDSAGGAKACKIILSDYSLSGEYFMAEVRTNERTTVQPPQQSAPKRQSPKTGGAAGTTATIGQNANLFDSCLSGSGLIVYRINERAAFLNESGEEGSRDFCNMYGDEVYVFRKGGGESLNSPLGTFSFALLGVNADKAGDSGNANENDDYSRFGIKKSQETQTKNRICYSDGENSGIVFENIVKNTDGSVTFNVTLPENDGNLPVLSEGTVKFANFPNGTTRLCWNMSAKSGYAYVLAIRATIRLERKAEKGQLMLSADEIKNGYYTGYKTLFFKKIPLAEKKVVLPEFSDDALIFIAAETDGGTFCSRYAGELKRNDLSLSQYVVKFFDPFLSAAAGVTAVVVVSVIIVIVIKTRPQKTFEKKKIKKE